MQRQKSRFERKKITPEIIINNSDFGSSESNHEVNRDQDLGTYPSFAKDLND